MSQLDQPVTLTPGRTGTLLADNRGGNDTPPLMIINQSADRAYVGDDSSVGPSNGVPLDGGTSLPWTQPGPVWVVADPTATNPVVVIGTYSIDDWTPSPYAIAAATAARLLALGVPNVLIADIIYESQAPNNTPLLDISRYSSLIFVAYAGDKWTAFQSVPSSSSNLALDVYIASDALVMPYTMAVGQGPSSVMLKCVGKRVLFRADAVSLNSQVVVIGTNREMSERLNARHDEGLIDNWSRAGSGPMTPGGYALGHNTPTVRLHGEVALRAYSTSTTVKGYWGVRDTAGTISVLADTSELTAQSNGQQLYKRVILPAAWTSVFFQCAVGGAADIYLDFLQVPN